MNRNMARRPTALASLMVACPDARATNTRGAMILLIVRRKMSAIRLKYEAMSWAACAVCACGLQK